LTIAHRIRHIPTDAPQDHVAFEMAALESIIALFRLFHFRRS
jgi:hypothetical protein